MYVCVCGSIKPPTYSLSLPYPLRAVERRKRENKGGSKTRLGVTGRLRTGVARGVRACVCVHVCACVHKVSKSSSPLFNSRETE